MTVSNHSIMASQMYANKEVQAQSGANGYAPQGTDTIPSFGDIAQQMMSLLDTDKSGSIDKTEFSQAAQALAKSSGKTDTSGVDAAFGKMDANNDGQISSDEFLNALKQAADQTQKQHRKHHRHTDATASNVLPQTEAVQPSSPMNEMQKNLFNKIMAAYGNQNTLSASTTSITA